jgi:hypothetical protein
MLNHFLMFFFKQFESTFGSVGTIGFQSGPFQDQA